MTISGSVALQNVLTNGGTVTMIGTANVTIYNNNTSTYQGGIDNMAGALWDIQTNANISCGICAGHEFFNNAGVLRKSQGSGTATIGVPFTNIATVTNLNGILSFNGGGTLGGTFDTASGATTYFASGSFSMGAPPAIDGSGLCEFSGGTLTLAQDVPANLLLAGGNLVLGPGFQNQGAITNLTLSGSTLPGTNTVTGAFSWSSGAVTGPLTIESGGLMNISGNVALENVLTNSGTVTMTGTAGITVYNNNTTSYLGGVYNLAGALWDIQTNASISCGICAGHEFFNNAGVLRKSQGSGTATIGVPFTNIATVTNLNGILSFNGGGTLGGTFDTASGATTYFASGSFSMGAPPAIDGSGLCEFSGGTLTLAQDVPANLLLAGGNLVLGPGFQNQGAITNLTLSGSTLPGTNTVTGAFSWSSGAVTGPLTIESGGLMNISGNVALENVLTNSGTVTMTGTAGITVYNNNTTSYLGGVYNLAGALWDIQTNASISCGICAGHEFFNNAGVLRKSQGSGTATIGVPFSNTAIVNTLAGTLSFSGSFTTTGGTLAFGVSGLSSFGQVNVSGSLPLNGTLSVTWLGGFIPAIGNSFALIDYGSHSGTFANIALPSGTLGQGNYGATVFSLLITSVTTQTNLPVLTIEKVNTSTVQVLWPTAAGNFNLQTSTNLFSGLWSNVTSGITTVGANYVLTTAVNNTPAFFRLRSQ